MTPPYDSERFSGSDGGDETNPRLREVADPEGSSRARVHERRDQDYQVDRQCDVCSSGLGKLLLKWI